MIQISNIKWQYSKAILKIVNRKNSNLAVAEHESIKDEIKFGNECPQP